LIEQGLFHDRPEVAEHAPVSTYLPSHHGTHLSVPSLLTATMRALEAALTRPEAQGDFPAAIGRIVTNVQRACQLDADAALGTIIAARSVSYPARHCANCAVLAELVMKRMQVRADEAQACLAGVLTMNLAGIDLQQAMYEQSAPATDEQKARIHAHPDQGAVQLRALGVADPLWLATVEQHHELWDGTGYPRKLAGEAIVRAARVAALADLYCALVSERAYRDGLNPAMVMKKMREAPGTVLDPAVLDAARRELGIYPPGSVVELDNGETAVVTMRTKAVEHPVAQAIVSDRKVRYPEPRKRLTNKIGHAIRKVLPQNALDPFPAAESLWSEAFVPDAGDAAQP
jgi:HD-GYP domain-containing protein (c-di-GMP phosphodiesterase class II)